MGYFLQPTTAAARQSRRAPVHNSRETAKTVVPEFFTVNSGRRFYSPELGRWLNRDPIAEDGGMNVYVYCDNETVSTVDPFGLRFINLGMIGTDIGHWEGGRGGQYVQFAGDIDAGKVDPVLEADCCRCWVKDNTGIINVGRSYYGLAQGFHGTRTIQRVRRNRQWITQETWAIYYTSRFVEAVNGHEESHMTATQMIYDDTIALAEQEVESHRKSTPLVYGCDRWFGWSQARACKDELMRRIDWNNRISEFSRREIEANGAGGLIDQADEARGVGYPEKPPSRAWRTGNTEYVVQRYYE